MPGAPRLTATLMPTYLLLHSGGTAAATVVAAVLWIGPAIALHHRRKRQAMFAAIFASDEANAARRLALSYPSGEGDTATPGTGTPDPVPGVAPTPARARHAVPYTGGRHRRAA